MQLGVGAGIIGLTTGYCRRRHGCEVTVVGRQGRAACVVADLVVGDAPDIDLDDLTIDRQDRPALRQPQPILSTP
jgi:glycine/D-amino acid oxidase-like deaminating enzyme